MGRTTGLLQKGYTATTAIAAHKLMKFGAADGTVVPATDGSAFIVGVQSELDCDVGDRASAAMVGNIEDVIFGGTVGRGQPLTADAQGRAVVATPGATAIYCIGFAEVSGVVGDIGTVIIAPHIIRGT